MSHTLILRPVARREFDDAADWYDEQQPGLGTRFIAEVNRVFEAICDNPEQYPVVHKDLRSALLRKFPYAIYFGIESNRAVVVSVFHSARDPEVWKSRAD